MRASTGRLPVLLAFACVALAAVGVFAASAGAHARSHHARHHARRHARHHLRRHARRSHAVAHRVRTHVETWAFDDGCNGGSGAGPALVRDWLTFAESNCGPSARKAVTDCQPRGRHYCQTMQYLDTDWDFPQQPPLIASTASEGWWLHQPGGSRIFSNDPTGRGYLDNQGIPAVRAFFRSYARRHFDRDHGLLMDWQSPSLSQELYYSDCHCASTSEIRSNTALQAAHSRMSAALTHRNGRPFIQVDNTLPSNPYLPQGLNMLNHATGVDGWSVEGEPESNGVLDPYYSTLLDQMAYIANRTRGFIVPMSRAPAGAPYQEQTRRVQEATILLGYRPGHVVDWANLEVGSGDLAVWPEESIYPTRPVQSMHAPAGRGCLAGTGVVCSRGGHNSVQVAPGVYRRQFRTCYRGGVAFGSCAAIMNTTGHPVVVRGSWLRGTLRHAMTFAGGDIQSGGSIRLAGAPFTAGVTAVPARDALLLAP